MFPHMSDPPVTWSAAERVFLNGRVITMNAVVPEAEAIAVRDGRIVGVGSSGSVQDLVVRGTEVVDLRGRTVVPGFIESHSHLLMYGLTRSFVDVNPESTRDIPALQQKLADAAKRVRRGEWIVAYGYDRTLYPEGRHLSRLDLDRAAPENPVYVLSLSGHLGYANGKALELSGIDRSTDNPQSGQIVRDEDGVPSGVLVEPGAMGLVASLLPGRGSADLARALRVAANDYSVRGITTATDVLGLIPGDFYAYQSISQDEDFPLRIVGLPAAELALGIPFTTGFGNDRFRIGAAKFWVDGSIQGWTALLSEPYLTEAEVPTGQETTVEDLRDGVMECTANGFSVAIHCNGDLAVEYALNAIESALKVQPSQDVRFQLIHCQVVSERQLKRGRDLGVAISFYTPHIYVWGDVHVRKTLGPARASRLNPMASAFKLGIRVSMHSDSPVTRADPLCIMWVAMNRMTRSGHVLGEEERITARQALAAFTTEAAYHLGIERDRGSLSVGKLADMVVLEEDPLNVEPSSIRDIQIAYTVCGGRILNTFQ